MLQQPLLIHKWETLQNVFNSVAIVDEIVLQATGCR